MPPRCAPTKSQAATRFRTSRRQTRTARRAHPPLCGPAPRRPWRRPAARATLIAHELAHYRRGDHWVRVFELVVSGIFWWNPVVWWARRQIEIAEEECCDAWVIEQFPDTPRWYAEALLETIDFLSE